MKKTKIMIVSPLGYTGLAYYDYSLCRSLAERGVNVELCTSDRWILGSYKENFRLFRLYRKCSGDISKPLKGLNYVISSFRILFHAVKNKIDIVHFQIVEIPVIDLFVMAALKFFGKRIVFTPHDIVHNKNFPLNKRILRFLYSISDRVIAHKEANLNPLVQDFGVAAEKIVIIPHGGYEYFVDTTVKRIDARQRLGVPVNDKVLLFLGNIKPGKGLAILLRAMPAVKASVPNIRLLIAGRACGGLTAEWVSSEIRKYGITEHVTARLEFISEREITDYFMACDLVILPYTEVSESGVLRYAQTCGKPVVCSDLREFKDTVVHGVTGYMFKNNDHDDLRATIIEALTDGNMDRVGANAKKLMDADYKWSRIATFTEKIYGKLVA
jgi:D-inositol-3-phosphate glycosyltransferase